jgi:hypothetical protein
MLSATDAACAATVFYNSAFKNWSRRIPQYVYSYIQQTVMTGFNLSELNKNNFFDDVTCLELLTIVNPAFAKRYQYLRRNRSSQRLSNTLLFVYRKYV